MDDRDNYRGWDMWLEGGRIATHLVHHWPEDALKVVARGKVSPGVWTHVFVTYDGSAKASGVKIYINGEPQETDVHADGLKQTIRSQVPLKVGQRHTGSRIDELVVHTLRVYDRALSPREAGILAGAVRAAALLRVPGKDRPSNEQEAVFAWWRTVMDPDSREAARQAGGPRGGRRRHQEARHLRRTSCTNAPSQRWHTCSTAASTTNAATRSSRGRPLRFR